MAEVDDRVIHIDIVRSDNESFVERDRESIKADSVNNSRNLKKNVSFGKSGEIKPKNSKQVDSQIIKKSETANIIEVRPQGEVRVLKADFCTIKETSNINQIEYDKVEIVYLNNPEDFADNIFIKLQGIRYIPRPDQLAAIGNRMDVDIFSSFVHDLNHTINDEHELSRMLRRPRLMRTCGWILFAFLLISACGLFIAGIHTELVRQDPKVTNEPNYKTNYSVPFFLITAFLIAMAVYILWSCIGSKILREYEIQRFKNGIFTRSVSDIVTVFNEDYANPKELHVEVAGNLNYIHVNFNSRNKIKLMKIKQ